MAAVAPAQPAPVIADSAAQPVPMTAAEIIAANTAANAATTVNPLDSSASVTRDPDEAYPDRDDDPDDQDDDDAEAEAPKEWDEGGRSHCGYSDSVHDTLMSIGESIHRVVGEPGEGVQGAMRGIGYWFQEASYAARDARRGELDVKGEAREAMKSVVSGDEEDDLNLKDIDEDGPGEDTEAGEGGEGRGEVDLMGRGGEEGNMEVATKSKSGEEGATSAVDGVMA